MGQEKIVSRYAYSVISGNASNEFDNSISSSFSLDGLIGISEISNSKCVRGNENGGRIGSKGVGVSESNAKCNNSVTADNVSGSSNSNSGNDCSIASISNGVVVMIVMKILAVTVALLLILFA